MRIRITQSSQKNSKKEIQTSLQFEEYHFPLPERFIESNGSK
jgi:hypothetical protein